MQFKNLVTLFLLLFSIKSMLSQESIDYLGVIKLNDTSLISYKLSLYENNGIVTGHSITDLGGAHETKSMISGIYDDKAKTFVFQEEGIVYTKSVVDEYDFCFVHFSGKLRNLNRKQNLKGKFRGLYNDSTECISGEIDMMRVEKVIKKALAVDRKIQRTRKIDAAVKKRVSVQKTLDTLNMNIIDKNETLSVFTRNPSIKITVYDAGKEDGDRINLFIDGKLVLDNYTVTKDKKKIKLPLIKKQTLLKIEALNVGTSAPNTVKVEIEDQNNFVRTITNLDAKDTAGITIIKE